MRGAITYGSFFCFWVNVSISRGTNIFKDGPGNQAKHADLIGSCYVVKIEACMYDFVSLDVYILYKLWPRPTH